jgi:transcriptional regulator with XRE-family HTH domain
MVRRNAMGMRIREIRQQRGMTVSELADAAGLTAGHVSRIERGMSMPSFVAASRIADVLGMHASELATVQRHQITTDADLVATLTSRGLDPRIAEEIRTKISTPARQALLEALSDA